MDRLIKAGLRFGNLLRIDQPNLVARYRKAMEGLGVTPTALDVFHVDASGYSPEVAEEVGDRRYLDPHGVNRRIIVLTPDQRKLPLLNVEFSADVALVRRFFIDNDRAIRTLTLKDAVYGEIENMTFDVSSVADIVGLREVRFELHTPTGILEAAQDLKGRAAGFMTDPDAWKSEDGMRAIVEGAKLCGDVRGNGILPTNLRYPWPDVFRTLHFGGLYVLRGPSSTTVIGPAATEADTLAAGAAFVDLDDHEGTFHALRDGAYMEPFNESWLRDSGVVEQRLDLFVVQAVCEADPSFDPLKAMDASYTNHMVHRYLDVLRGQERFRALSTMRQVLGNGGDAAAFDVSLPARHRMMFRRALPEHVGAWDINRLLLRRARFDILSLYCLDKPSFYARYETLDSRMRDFAVQYIVRNYQGEAGPWRRKAEYRERIFGIHQI